MQGVNIKLSLRTQKLMKQLQRECSADDSRLLLLELLSYLDEQSVTMKAQLPEQKINLFHLALSAELITDLAIAMNALDAEFKENDTTVRPSLDKLKFIILALAGALKALCEGFDNMATMMSVFASSSLLVLICGLSFSLCSAIAFCGIDFVKLSLSLEIRLGQTPTLVDAAMRQFNHIRLIREKITSTYDLTQLSADELEHLAAIGSSLADRMNYLIGLSEQFNQLINSELMHKVRFFLSAVACILFFGGGFCAGQTISMYVLGLFTTVTIASLPVVMFSILVGVAAFSFAWQLELPGFKALVNSWFGLHEDKMAKLCDKTQLEKELQRLTNLNKNIQGIAALKKQTLQVPVVNETEQASDFSASAPFSFWRSANQPSSLEQADLTPKLDI